ncbi:MAG TPA: tetratricopeptide repeat protein, partial [Planctomycetota bacterium]|nr:tetratricopeptide repeat protein [Planctomycetota bacterium]
MRLAAAVVLLASARQGPAPDPLGRVREMLQRGEVADAAEAVAGLPEPARTRMEAWVSLAGRDLEGARRFGERALERNPQDPEILFLLAHVAAKQSDLDECARRAGDARAVRAGPWPELDALERWLAEQRTYLERLATARTRSRVAMGATLALAA